MATKKYIKNKTKSRRRGNRKTQQRGGCTSGVCMSGGNRIGRVGPGSGATPSQAAVAVRMKRLF